MKVPERFHLLTLKNKKIILYKIAEIYGGNDELLEFIDSLEGANIDTVCNIVFAENNEERQRLRDNEFNSLGKTIEEINNLKKSIDKLILELTEFSEKVDNEKDIENIENLLENMN